MLRFHGRVVALWRGGQWGRAVRLEKASRLDGGELPEADAFVWAARNGDDVISFGGTSIACTGVAGVAALILAHNSALRWDQVREVLRQSCDRIDDAGGNYDASGRSPFYCFGRVNARKAVELALPPQPSAALVFQVVQDVLIADFQTATLALPVAGPGPLKTIKVAVDLDHTYICDLVLKLLPPVALGAAPVVLHNQTGGGTDNIKKTYDEVNTPALTSLKGKVPSGTWTLEVADKVRADTGTLRSLRLVLTF